MAFSRRYPLWLIGPPAVLGLSLSTLFLSQVIEFSASHLLTMLLTTLAVYGTAGAIFYFGIARAAAKVEAAVDEKRRVGEAMSECLLRTELFSLLMWIGGGLLFAAISCALILPTFLGFQYFIEAGLIAAATAMAWNYWAGKRLLISATEASPEVIYVGRIFTFDKKIAMVFIGYFMISCGALVHLISSRVSTTLENLALSGESERFDRLYEALSAAPSVDRAALEKLKASLPPDYSLARISPDGSLTALGEGLDPDEIRAILRIKNGDSSRYIGPHVTKFRALKDRSIIALSVPWTPYQNIPYQIAFYTVIIALLTTIIFAIATYFLSRDLAHPVKVLMNIASEMARGNFDPPVHVFSDDEVGELAESFRETRNNLRRLLGRISGSGASITDGVRVITGGTDSLIVRSREQNDLTTNSTEAVDTMRRGIASVVSAVDKVSGLTQDSSSRAVELQASSEEIARSMDHLFQSVEKTSSSTAQMDASAGEMSNRTAFLAKISDEVLTFVSEMESTADELRRNATATADLSRKVQEDAEEGGSAVNDTVMGINLSQEMTQRAASVLAELQTSVGKISQILIVIEEIADKTNLLSLNAAIIAAQAGEHGLGFTVVADEIRELAERTRGSTKEIGGIIKAIQRGSREAMHAMDEGVSRVNDNVRVAQNAADSLAQIVASSGRSYEMANRMSKALQEQAEASRHLHEVTSKMSDHIAEINRSTTEQARGSKLLAEESEKVRDIALQVKNSTEQQSIAGGGIAVAMEQIAGDIRSVRDLLQRQLDETDRVADASRTMLDIARENEQLAQAFNQTVKNLLASGQEFESEVKRFRITEH